VFVANKILVTFDTDVEHAALLMVFLFMSKIKKELVKVSKPDPDEN